MKPLLRLVGALLLLALSPILAPAVAQTDASIAGFAADDYGETEKALGALATGSRADAPAIVEALRDGRLLASPSTKLVVYKDAKGATLDAATGQPAATAPADLSPVRLNNRLRRSVDAALGALTLMSADPARRLAAAGSAFKAREPNALPALEAALAKESDAKVQRELASARAAILAAKADAAEAQRVGAIGLLRNRADQEARTALAVVASNSQGAVKAAADEALRNVDSRLALWANAQNVWYGLSLGSVLLLAAIGLAITFGVMGVINMAHGEMVMLGAYTTFVVQEWIRANNPALFDVSLLIALPLAFLVAGAVGVLIERTVIRFLYGRALETLLATWGVSLILQQAVRTWFGANNREVGAPSWMSGSFELGGLSITYGRMWIVVFTIGVFFALQLVLRATPFGLRMRAVTQNRRMASAMGIDTNRIDALAFGLGSGIAGVAGVALSQIDNVSPNLGQSYIIDSFMVVVFGGVGNLWGTLVAALTLGVANKFLEPFVGAVLGKIALLVFIILFIQKRPRGMFALKGRAVEA